MTPRLEQDGLKLYWGILHCHIPGEYCHVQEPFSEEMLAAAGREMDRLYHFARDEMQLDFLAYADHHNMGRMVALGDRLDSPWHTVVQKADEHNEEGRFVAIKGYEFQDGMEYNVYLHEAPALPLADRWEELIAQVEPGDPHVILAAHYRPNPTDWTFPLHENFRLIEIVNDGGAPFEDWGNGGLAAGHHAGFIAGSDDHSSRPGRTVATGVWARALTREAIWEALFERRCLAAKRHRPTVAFRMGETWMGEQAPAPRQRVFQVEHQCEKAPLSALLIRNGSAVPELPAPGASFALRMEDTAPASGMREDYYYVKLIYPDGGFAYTSPLWLRNGGGKSRKPPRKPAALETEPPLRWRKVRDLGSRVGWHRFVNAHPLAAASPSLRMSKATRDMVIHAGPDAVLATESNTVIVPAMDGLREYRLNGHNELLRPFGPKEDLTLLVTSLVEAGECIIAAGYRGERPTLQTLRGESGLSVEGLPAVRPFYFGNKLVTPQYLGSDGSFLYCLGERELFVLLPGGEALASCQVEYPSFPCAVAAANLGNVYVLSCDGALVAYDLSASQAGRVRWTVSVPDGHVSLLASDAGIWVYNDRLVPCAMQHRVRVRTYDESGTAMQPFALELFNLRGAGLARLPDGRLAGVHNPSRRGSAIYRETLNETGVLRILEEVST